MSEPSDSTRPTRTLRRRGNGPRTQPPNPAESSGTSNSEPKAKGANKRKLADKLNVDTDKDDSRDDEGATRVGDKPTRDRLLDLLGKRLTRKRTRFAEKTSPLRKKTKTETESAISNSKSLAKASETAKDAPLEQPSSKFTTFSDSQLVDMIRQVGLDLSNSDRESLIRSCLIYEDLICLPPNPQSRDTASTSGTCRQTSPPSADFTSRNMEDKIGSVTGQVHSSVTSTPPLPASTSNLPSLEHGNLSFPRPRPTILHSDQLPSRSRKGKEKATSESEWTPADVEFDNSGTSDHDGDNSDVSHISDSITILQKHSATKKHQRKSAPSPKTTIPADSAMMNSTVGQDSIPPTFESSTGTGTAEPSTIRSILDRHSAQLAMLSNQLGGANAKIENLTEELRTLSQTVKRQLSNGIENKSKKSKIRGGRTSARIRFHVETLFGQKLDRGIPPPATDSEKEGWDYEQDLEKMEIDPKARVVHSEAGDDPCFPYPDGPGHTDSSSQQLSVIWQMMNAVGISTFRPDLGQAPTTDENRWLWDVALKIFLKLVEIGEYTGISLDADNRSYIKKCFDTHIQSLMKRYRQVGWTQERKAKVADRTRRSSRRDTLVTLRTKLLVQEEIFALFPIVDTTCSDDETDAEAEVTHTGKRSQLPCLVRRMEWRSPELEDIWLMVDQLKAKFDQSLPGNVGSGSPGRARRPRIRGNNNPLSLIKPPQGLSNDCFMQSWLDKLSGPKRLALEISPVSMLPSIKLTLERLLRE